MDLDHSEIGVIAYVYLMLTVGFTITAWASRKKSGASDLEAFGVASLIFVAWPAVMFVAAVVTGIVAIGRLPAYVAKRIAE